MIHIFFYRNLSAIQDREICCYSISCKEKENIGKWLKREIRKKIVVFSPDIKAHILITWRPSTVAFT